MNRWFWIMQRSDQRLLARRADLGQCRGSVEAHPPVLIPECGRQSGRRLWATEEAKPLYKAEQQVRTSGDSQPADQLQRSQTAGPARLDVVSAYPRIESAISRPRSAWARCATRRLRSPSRRTSPARGCRSTELSDCPYRGLADAYIRVLKSAQESRRRVRRVDQAQIGRRVRSLARAPGAELGEVILDESEIAVKRGDGVIGIAPEVEGQAQKDGPHQLPIEGAKPQKVTRVDRGAV